jgi:NAD dependent epimerase/dehydratase family enzyme
MGVAGRLGSGRQYLSWISLADEVAAIEFLLTHDVDGPVNLTAPAPVTNAEFIATFGRILHRPTAIPVPAFAMRLVLGELAEDALTGQRALPAKLSAAGFGYEHEDVASALRWALNR